jgi:hypothetical protein
MTTKRRYKKKRWNFIILIWLHKIIHRGQFKEMSCKMCVVVLLFNTSFFVNEYPIFALLLSSLLSSQTKDIDIIPRSMIQTTVFGVFLILSLVCCLKFCFEIWDFIFLKISRSWHGLIILIKRSINYAGLMLRDIFSCTAQYEFTWHLKDDLPGIS